MKAMERLPATATVGYEYRQRRIQGTGLRPVFRSRMVAFSLIEMLLAFVLLVVILALAVPRFDGALTRNALSAASNALVADLMFARSEALRRAASVGLCPRNAAVNDPIADTENVCATTLDALTWGNGWVVYVGTTDDVDSVIRVAAAPSARVDSLSGPTQAVRFDALGTTTGARQFNLDAGDVQRRVFVARAGGVRGCLIEEGKCR